MFVRPVSDVKHQRPEEWDIKIIDLGYAVSMGDPSAQLSLRCGSGYFKAPEVESEHSYSTKADLYSIGVALVAVMTGKYPFSMAKKMTAKAMAKKKIRSEWNADAKAAMAKLDAHTVELMRALLTVDPSKRPSAAEALHYPFFKNLGDDSKVVDRATLSAMSTHSEVWLNDSDEELYNLFAKETGMSACAPYGPLCSVCYERALCASKPCAMCTALSTADVVSAFVGDLQTDVCVSAALLTLRRAAQAEWASSSSSSVALTHYVKAECARREVSAAQLESMRTEGRLLDLDDAVCAALSTDDGALVLLKGESGSGKSVCGRRVAQVFWAKHDDDDDEKKDATAAVHSTITPVVVPLFVSLPSAFGRECAQCDLIDEVLERRGLGKATRDVLRAKVRFVLILDAFDEISAAYAGGASVLNLSDRLGLGLWNAKTMVSCRSGVTMDESSLFRVGDTPPSVLHICPFDPTRVSAYVVGFAKSPMNKSGWDAAQYADALSGCLDCPN
jgi:hypothetical protein